MPQLLPAGSKKAHTKRHVSTAMAACNGQVLSNAADDFSMSSQAPSLDSWRQNVIKTLENYKTAFALQHLDLFRLTLWCSSQSAGHSALYIGRCGLSVFVISTPKSSSANLQLTG